MANNEPRRKRRDGFGWYVTFVLIAVVAFFALSAVTGQEALAAALRVIWNGFALVANLIMRGLGSLLSLIARGVGWRRLTRIANVIGGIGLGYAASVVFDDEKVRKARGWRGQLRAAIGVAKAWWQNLRLIWKLVIVAVLIASQIYLHSMFIVFPIAFLVPVVQRLWVRIADMVFGTLYWGKFGNRHRRMVAWFRRLPGLRNIIGWVRLTRIRYLTAWRLWKYHPRYHNPETNRRIVSLVEPLRLWMRGELDGYIGRPLLAGPRFLSAPPCPTASEAEDLRQAS